MRLNQKGLTVTELLVALVAMSALLVVLIGFLVNYWQYSMYQQADLNSLVERLNTSDYLRENIGSSSGLITQNSIDDTYVGYVDPDDVTNNHWYPMHAIPGTITTGQNGAATPVMYYKRYSVTPNNDLIYNGTSPYEDEFMIYLDETKKELRVRTLVNPNTTATNRLKTTCPPASATPTCPKDTVLISGVASVDKRFFSRSGNLIDWTSIYDPDINEYVGPDNANVEVVELKINVESKAIFQKTETTKNTTTIRVALRNT